jgi:hypothetical protein
MLPVSLDCQFQNTHSVFSNVCLFCFAEVNATAETNTFLEDECLTSYHHPGMTFTDYKVHDCNDEFMFACSNTSCKHSKIKIHTRYSSLQ